MGKPEVADGGMRHESAISYGGDSLNRRCDIGFSLLVVG